MKNPKISLFFVFALSAIIAISYLPVNAEEMEKSMTIMKINEMGEGIVHSPNKQMSMGIDGKDVVCNTGYDLVMRLSGKVACCTSSTAMKLESRGLGTIEKTDAMMEKERGEMMMDAKEVMAQAAETTTSVPSEIFLHIVDNPTSIAFDSTGTLYVADAGLGTVQQYDSAGNLLNADFAPGHLLLVP